MTRRLTGLVLVIATAALLAGCGGSSSSPDAVVQDFFDAARDNDAEAACELLSSASIEAIEASGDEDCPTAFEADGVGDIPDDIEVGEVTEDGDTATVQVTGDGEEVEIPTVNEDDEWKVDFASLVPSVSAEPPDISTEAIEPPDVSAPEIEPPEPVEP